MALRLTSTTLSQPAFSPDAIAAAAESRLATNDLDGYAELFAQAAAHDKAAGRHLARLRLVERGLFAASRVAPATASRIYHALAARLVEILAEEPREPMLLNYAGIAFYELWSLDAARDLFRAAARLDPELPHLRSNLRGTDARRKVARGGRPAPLYPDLPALAQQARAAAAQARPAEGRTLSLCMIVKNEEEMLPRSLAAAAPFVDEIIVVDTGSTDDTIEIARSFGATVIEREWTGSFSEARNASFDAATSDWVMYLDADEVLVADDGEALRALTAEVWREAFFLVETSYTGEEDQLTGVVHNSLRVFRNRPEYRFDGRLHEQVQNVPFEIPGRVEPSAVRVLHYGYLGAVRDARGKSERNIELLRAQQSEQGANAFWHFNLGMEYLAITQYDQAVSELRTAWKLTNDQGLLARQYVPALISRLTSALVSAQRNREAVELVDEVMPLFAGFTDLLFFKGWALVGLGRPDDAAEVWRTCLEMGDAPSRFTAGLGAGSFMCLYALAYGHMSRGEHSAAAELLERSLSEHPGFSAAVAPYITVLLAQGIDGSDAVSRLEEHFSEPMSTSTRFIVASALQGAGALAAAEGQYRLVLESRPSAAHVRVNLAELLIALGRNDEAVAEAGLVPDDDANAVQAARLELWATVASGHLDRLGDALARATQRGVPLAHRLVFQQWAAITAGQPAGASLPMASAPMLGVVLERLLARHEFDTFEAVVGLLHASEMPAREQRELLATMYLRFGFIKSAAQEWMAVCQTAPDARALLGLARVAVAHGTPEDAVVFAGQAVALDPNSEAARALLGELQARVAAPATA